MNDPKKPSKTASPQNDRPDPKADSSASNSEANANSSASENTHRTQPSNDTSKQTDSQQPTHSVQTTPPQRQAIRLLLFLLMLATAAASYGGWWLWQQQHRFSIQTAAQLERFNASEQQRVQQLQTLEQNLASQQRERDALSERINTLQSELLALAENQTQRTPSTALEQQLNDVAFLLRTARHIGLLTGELHRVEALLEQANQQLQATQRLALLPIREALQQDLQKVRSLPRTDLDEIYLQLAALSNDAQQWQWWPSTRLRFEADTPIELTTEGWQAVWQEIRHLVRIHERAEQRFETLDAASFELARQQYQHFLLQAQSALLLGQQNSFEQSLLQAIAWLDGFSEYIPQYQQLHDQLEAIRAQSIVRLTPDIQRALERLEQFQRSLDGDR